MVVYADGKGKQEATGYVYISLTGVCGSCASEKY